MPASAETPPWRPRLAHQVKQFLPGPVIPSPLRALQGEIGDIGILLCFL